MVELSCSKSLRRFHFYTRTLPMSRPEKENKEKDENPSLHNPRRSAKPSDFLSQHESFSISAASHSSQFILPIITRKRDFLYCRNALHYKSLLSDATMDRQEGFSCLRAVHCSSQSQPNYQGPMRVIRTPSHGIFCKTYVHTGPKGLENLSR